MRKANNNLEECKTPFVKNKIKTAATEAGCRSGNEQDVAIFTGRKRYTA